MTQRKRWNSMHNEVAMKTKFRGRVYTIYGYRSLRPQNTSAPRHFAPRTIPTSAAPPVIRLKLGAEVSGHFGTNFVVPECLVAKVSGSQLYSLYCNMLVSVHILSALLFLDKVLIHLAHIFFVFCFLYIFISTISIVCLRIFEKDVEH